MVVVTLEIKQSGYKSRKMKLLLTGLAQKDLRDLNNNQKERKQFKEHPGLSTSLLSKSQSE